MLKKGDFFLAGFILLIAIAGIGAANIIKQKTASESMVAVIKQDDKIIEKINLDDVSEQRRIEIDGSYKEIILVEKGRIRFESADCPDKVCVRTGWLEETGDMAVCIPNRVIIKIEGTPDKLDGVTY